MRLQSRQRLVHPLTRQADQVRQLLLGDSQNFTHARVQHRIEQCSQAAGNAHIRVVQAVNLARGNKLGQTFIELVHHKTVKANGVVQQPVKRVNRQPGHHAFAQRLNVVAIWLALECSAFAKPAAGRHAGVRHGHALVVVTAHFEQAFNDPEPVSDRPANPAHIVPCCCVTHAQSRSSYLALKRV